MAVRALIFIFKKKINSILAKTSITCYSKQFWKAGAPLEWYYKAFWNAVLESVLEWTVLSFLSCHQLCVCVSNGELARWVWAQDPPLCQVCCFAAFLASLVQAVIGQAIPEVMWSSVVHRILVTGVHWAREFAWAESFVWHGQGISEAALKHQG